ncbi:hypothetical protein MRS44_015747 [Fusarium solani]|uniref:uncharacterized protein n=1 Tax=Fusarium solani TaxID=169388 RepID=UPI0032C3F4A7|nr:hypothetical protein MRS44_015747 [Fusarium solani]
MQRNMSSPTSAPQKSSLYANLHMSGRQIRLLQITSTKPEIVCRLEVVSLEDEPAYSALSYVWGDPAITRTVLVNGERVNVTTNLASALEHAPKHLEGSNVAPRLWADALCINQDDPNEKNHQVPFMKDIYSQAEIVICWLRPPNDKIHRDTLHDLSLQKDSKSSDLASAPNLTRSEDADIDLNETATTDNPGASDVLASYQKPLQELSKRRVPAPESGNSAWLANYPSFYERLCDSKHNIEDLPYAFRLPYWTRIWVFQEVALAKKPIFACGTRSVSLASLAQLTRWAQWLMDDTTIVRPWVIERARRAAGHPILPCLKARDGKISLESHWGMACNLSTSNPKDYFYGFLSLSCLDLVPDYSSNTSVGMVCRDFMVEYVRASREGTLGTTSGELDLLAFAGVGHGWYEYPDTRSWAPNFPGIGKRTGKGSPILSSRLSHFEELFLPSSEKVSFTGSDMLVTVLILDKIQELGPERRDFSDGEAWYGPQGVFPWVVDIAASRQKYVTGCHPLAVLHSLLNFESNIQEGEPALSIPDLMGFVWWIAACYKRRVHEESVNIDARKPDPKIEYLDCLLRGVPLDMNKVNEASHGLLQNCFKKVQRLAETSRRYVGIFPLYVQPGDVVCVVNGLRCPAVLRKVGLESAKQVQQLAEKEGKQVETIVIR